MSQPFKQIKSHYLRVEYIQDVLLSLKYQDKRYYHCNTNFIYITRHSKHLLGIRYDAVFLTPYFSDSQVFCIQYKLSLK